MTRVTKSRAPQLKVTTIMYRRTKCLKRIESFASKRVPAYGAFLCQLRYGGQNILRGRFVPKIKHELK